MFSSMFVGVTGAVAHNTMIQTIGHNLANVNTIGFKNTRALFEDLMYENTPTGGGVSPGGAVFGAGQVGKGVRVSDIMTDYRQGSFEMGTFATDLAIGGKGFFRVVDDQGRPFYTRAGSFRFDNQGVLRDMNRFALQGVPIDPATGLPGGGSQTIRLPMAEEERDGRIVNVYRSDPKATESMMIITNLDSGSPDRTHDPANPFFSLGLAWDGSSQPPLAESQYAYLNGTKIYDADGTVRNVTIYFDPVRSGINQSGPGGTRHWEYVVTVDPSEDGRALADPKAGGLLMMGTLTFNAAGNVVNQTAYVLDPSAPDSSNLDNWQLAPLVDGRPAFDAVFRSSGGGALAPQSVNLNFGLDSRDDWSDPGARASAVGSNVGSLPSMNAVPQSALFTTSFASSSVTLTQNQDGSPVGYLNYLSVNLAGVLTAYYSNGQSEDLYQVSLYNFPSEYGLRREGGNLFSESPNSGAAIEGVPGQDGLGTIAQSTLEQSNVDLATEFANLILGQRGFQANTKVITTADSIISTLNQMKR